jgi:Zn finger protein HypA/HybF involved in hydrogenase expression
MIKSLMTMIEVFAMNKMKIKCDDCGAEMIEDSSLSTTPMVSLVATSTSTSADIKTIRMAGSSGDKKIEKIIPVICPRCHSKKQHIVWAK